jgi:hypothetical protein
VGEGDGSRIAGSAPPQEESRPGYLSQIHLEWTVLLVVILVVLVYVGWSLRPQSSGFSQLDGGLYLTVQAPGVGAVTETLTRTPANGAQLAVRADLAGSSQRWTVSGSFGTGSICTPAHIDTAPAGALSTRTLPGSVTPFSPTSPYTVRHQPVAPIGAARPTDFTSVTSGGSVLYVRICWSPNAPDAPVKLNGSYLSALFPTNDPDQQAPPVTVTGNLVANAGNTANFAIQSQTSAATAGSSSDAWSWTLSSLRAPIHLTAVDTGAQQDDQFHAFLAGIVLGIAGGALIAILQELVAPFNRRRDERRPGARPTTAI